MRIAIFTDTFLPQVNGVTNTLERFADYLEEFNIDYMFIAPDQKHQQNIPYNVESILSAPFFLYSECRLSLPNMIALNHRLDKFAPDIIFLMTEFTIGMSGLLYGKKHDIPIVSNYSTNFATILKAYHLGVFIKPLNKFLTWFHGEAKITLTPSYESEAVLHDLGIKNTGIFGRGIDYHRFSPEYQSREWRKNLNIDDKIVLLYVGRISPEKDLHVLQDSMFKLNKKHGDAITLVMIGDGPLKAELEKTMPNNVIFLGYQKGIELSKAYASSDIFVFPSSFETFGNVVLEAFASETPVVGVAKGGVNSLIDHGVSGFLADPFDFEGFSDYTEELINNELMRSKMAQKGRKVASERSWDSIFDGLLSTFNEIMDGTSYLELTKNVDDNKKIGKDCPDKEIAS